MADKVTAKASESKFQIHPEGQFPGLCIDVVNLGDYLQTWPNEDSYITQKCALIFRTNQKNKETGEYIEIGREFTVSMGAKGNLRPFLEAWRGRPYSEEKAKEGVELEKMVGHPALLTIVHEVSKGKGNKYAKVRVAVGLPSAMHDLLPTTDKYERAKFWADKKKEYADAVAAYHAQQGARNENEFEDYPGDESQEDDDSDLPF